LNKPRRHVCVCHEDSKATKTLSGIAKQGFVCFVPSWLVVSFVVVGLIVSTGCTTPSQPTSFGISCPVSQALISPDGNPVTINYAAPVISGGTTPVNSSCSPASGSKFPLGATLITCKAEDARHLTASCGFEVQVRAAPPKPPQLAATRFVAFGDSITEGFTQTCPNTLMLTFTDYLRDVQSVRPPPESPISYPNRLRSLLAARYPAQSFTVINEGNGGEFVADGAADLPRVLTQDNPQVLLLQEGTNDMDGIFFGANPETQMTTVVNNLRTMIRTARARGITVFVGTLTPQRAGACRGYAPAYIGPVNDRIRPMLASEEATLADLYAAFGSTAGTDLIGPDGLHPNEAGYSKIADTFFDAIRQRLEN
jgi:lysophospholipase L1-like esterase